VCVCVCVCVCVQRIQIKGTKRQRGYSKRKNDKAAEINTTRRAMGRANQTQAAGTTEEDK